MRGLRTFILAETAFVLVLVNSAAWWFAGRAVDYTGLALCIGAVFAGWWGNKEANSRVTRAEK